MTSNNRAYFGVGAAFIVFVIALLFLAIYATDFNMFESNHSYRLKARFDNVTGLHERSPIRIAGVNVGRVERIILDSDYRAVVSMSFDKDLQLPADSAVKVYTEGLLGGRYLSITVGFDTEQLLKNGGVIEHTSSGMVLEDFLAGAVNAMRGKDV